MAYLDVVAKSPGKRQKVGFWEELLGILNWISSVLVSGRFHLAQIVSARRAAAGYGHARATPSLAAECRWWANVVTKWNRVAILLPPVHAPSPYHISDSLATDAAGGDNGGGGGFFAGLWTAVWWSKEEIECLDIMELEALMYVIFLKMVLDHDPSRLAGRRFVARNDNQPWVASCNSNDSTKPAIAVLLEWLHELMALYSFSVELEWIPSHVNVMPDALSREERSRFLKEALNQGFPASSLVRLQMPDRSSIVSRMMSAKCSGAKMRLGRLRLSRLASGGGSGLCAEQISTSSSFLRPTCRWDTQRRSAWRWCYLFSPRSWDGCPSRSSWQAAQSAAMSAT